jgi:hypothetical protein
MSTKNRQPALSVVKKLIVIFGVISALVLATVAAVVIAHGSVSIFMWIRAGILLAATPLIYSWAHRAGQGLTNGLERLRTVSLILPLAIVVVDLIPGMCPAWYTVMQGVSALALVAVAVITRTGALRVTRAGAN